MKNIKDLYKDSDYEIQLKAPVLNAFLSLALSLMVILALLQGITSFTWVDLITNVFIIGLVLSCILILRKGDYRLSSSLFIYAIAFLIGLSDILDGYSGEYVLPQNLLVSVMIILAGLFFLTRFRHLIIALTLTAALSFTNILYVTLAGKYTEQTGTLGDQLITPLVIYTMAALLSLLFRKTMDRLIGDARHKTEEAEEKALFMRSLAQEARTGLTEAQSMEDQAIESASAIVEIEENVNGIHSKMEMLTEQYNSSLDSLNLISENMSSLESVAVDQSSNITETSAALEEMVASIANVSHVIDGKMLSVQQLINSAEKGAGVIKETTLSFEQVLNHLDSVKQMITIISSVASQTNLLAMNAAIEAAHAGEAGRGFAVVSDEVRKLAESSAINAKQVNETIKLLVDSIESAGNNIRNSGSTFSVISGEVRLVGDAMKEIGNSINELAAGNDEILRATTSMNSLTQQVTENVSHVR
ncbi:MAG: methyl-accepting chemotaxis protein, partial [Spirochaetales bacterium]|nr:methyl-accepting chemotaxis protein [Spirochaetales bacterium]